MVFNYKYWLILLFSLMFFVIYFYIVNIKDKAPKLIEEVDFDIISSIKPTSKNIKAGKEIFKKHCVSCHQLQKNSESNTQLNLIDEKGSMWKYSRKSIASIIFGTVGSKSVNKTYMPYFLGVLNEKQVGKVIVYILDNLPQNYKNHRKLLNLE